MRPRDVPFANWIQDVEKLMIELGQVPLPERKLDGTFETDASCPSGEKGKVVYYDITASPPIITKIYMTLKDNCGSEMLAVELDRNIADRTLFWQALRTIFAKYFTSTFLDQGRRGNKEGSSRVGTGDGEEEGVEDTEVAEEGMDGAAAGTEEEGTGASAAMPASTPLPLLTVEEETQGIANRGVANLSSRARTSGPRTTVSKPASLSFLLWFLTSFSSPAPFFQFCLLWSCA
uniref:Uncharacterized protein n=1 Tax=Chromera velia CCMP2878 TaxID=1169474 RepID=A0A0G4IAG0_9ALVE|eukprot:Cvel_12539.t1-p1 / transcript=Cvel_12539.t1 / gene=Cvel_12539 / organism=Chromera_velia_CCMP2878 / gene_product=hypothetical protein / transcript_product=hypothetical protein / location=Cvel_scaffold824:6864-7650(+) / protein_length=232 / sequence_SO=supercontig / SO=protein_coding / is_pseudo=false